VSPVLVCRLAEVGPSADGASSASVASASVASASVAALASAGGKAAGLGELIRAGMPVPPGFAVLASAFSEMMAAVDPAGSLRRSVASLDRGDVASVARVAAGVRERIRSISLPPEVAAQITGAYEALGATAAVPVAVRSSATLEDSTAASFAGLQDTYLAVRGPAAVLDAVRRCWASLYNDESVAYRRRLGLLEDGLAMGVVVQRMVRPRAAGVMFTRSPVTGDRSVVAIEGTWGLGSALVAGEVTPDRFTVSKVTGEITGRQVGAKLRLHSFTPNEPGISSSATPLALRGRPCLTDDEARALASAGRRVEEHYGRPQDIEWALLGGLPGDDPVPPGGDEAALSGDDPALSGDDPALSGEEAALSGEEAALLGGGPAGRIRLLQSRPETVWAARSRDPVATPKPRASDHVLAWLEKPT
jgi:pyruvate, water dikinase